MITGATLGRRMSSGRGGAKECIRERAMGKGCHPEGSFTTRGISGRKASSTPRSLGRLASLGMTGVCEVSAFARERAVQLDGPRELEVERKVLPHVLGR